MTQDFLSMMLGVNRTAVSIAASTLQEAGLIRYLRGSVTVQNRQGLEDAACECYTTVSKDLNGASKSP
jgi:DNA-binding transcriptional regulator YhcF (GntR family)